MEFTYNIVRLSSFLNNINFYNETQKWDLSKKLNLLNSLKNNYPIGSIIINNENIIDGKERISTIIGCFCKNEQYWENDIIYNLKDDKFEYLKKDKDIYQVPLYYFTDGEYFYDFQIKLNNSNLDFDKNILIERYKKLGNIFSRYLIAEINLNNCSINDINNIKLFGNY